MEISKIVWRKPAPKNKYKKHNDFDVGISVKRDSSDRWFVRFGFMNRAYTAIGNADYVMVSSILDNPQKIYFYPLNERTNASFKINKSSTSRSTKFSLADSYERELYRTKWVGHYPLKLDASKNLYYIELSKKEVSNE